MTSNLRRKLEHPGLQPLQLRVLVGWPGGQRSRASRGRKEASTLTRQNRRRFLTDPSVAGAAAVLGGRATLAEEGPAERSRSSRCPDICPMLTDKLARV
jgi:hypothetical protein